MTVRRGTFVAIAGPSGAGKDSVMRAVAEARSDVMIARRLITRPPSAETEDFQSIDPAGFESLRAQGAFALDWQAHGLSYAIPASVGKDLLAGRHVLANLSRAVVGHACRTFPPAVAVVITAPRDVLAGRLAARGREAPQQIEHRLARADTGAAHVEGARVIENAGTLQEAVEQVLALLPQPVSG